MKEEELPVYLQNALCQLKNSSSTVGCDIEDALSSASCVEEFQERVSHAMNNLIGEAECVKEMISANKDQGSTMSEILTVADARQIAFETLRYVATMPDWENFKDLVGRELDITDEIIDQAACLLFSGDETGPKKTESNVDISEEEELRRLVDRYYVLEEEIDMSLPKLRNYGKDCDCGLGNRVVFKQIFEGDFDEIAQTCLNCGGTIQQL